MLCSISSTPGCGCGQINPSPALMNLLVRALDHGALKGEGGADEESIIVGVGNERLPHAEEQFSQFDAGCGSRVRGHVVMVQVGEYLIRVQADGPEGVRRSGVMALAEAQMACLLASDACPPLPVADAEALILPGAPGAAFATPTALE